jgi:hypothetical protein
MAPVVVVGQVLLVLLEQTVLVAGMAEQVRHQPFLVHL